MESTSDSPFLRVINPEEKQNIITELVYNHIGIQTKSVLQEKLFWIFIPDSAHGNILLCHNSTPSLSEDAFSGNTTGLESKGGDGGMKGGTSSAGSNDGGKGAHSGNTSAFTTTSPALATSLLLPPTARSIEPKDGGNKVQVICQFHLGGEKYFTQGVLSLKNQIYELEFNQDFFRIQRRDNYRMKLPPAFKAQLHISLWEGQSVAWIYPLYDLSGGGCRFLVKTPQNQLKIHQMIHGRIILEDREAIPIRGLFRHISALPKDSLLKDHSKMEKDIYVGVEFIDTTEKEKNRMSALVMDLYRILFLSRQN